MNKTEAKILALKAFANHADIIIDSMDISMAIYTEKDLQLINEAFDDLTNNLLAKAKRLQERNNKRL